MWKLTLVRSSNRVVKVIGAGSTAELMSPPVSNLGTSRNGKDVAVLNRSNIASNVSGLYVENGVVVGRSTDALELALIGTVDGHLLENGVGAGRGHEGREDGSGLHVGLLLRVCGGLGIVLVVSQQD